MATFSRLFSAPIELFKEFLSGLIPHRSSPSIADPQTSSQISQSARSDLPMLPVDSDINSLMIEEGNQNPAVPSNTETVPNETEFGKRLQKRVKFVFGFTFLSSVTIIIAVVTNMRKLARNHREHNLYEASAGFALLCFFASVGLLISVLAEWRAELAQRAQIGLMVVAVVSLIPSVVAFAMNIVI